MKNYILNRRKIYYKFLILFFISCLIGEKKQLKINKSTIDLNKLKANISFKGGLINIQSSESSNELNGFIEFNSNSTQPILKYSTIGKMGILDVESTFEIEYEYLKNKKEYQNKADFSFPNSIPIKFNMDYSLADVNINFNNIEVSSFNFDFGLGSAVIKFGEELNLENCNDFSADIRLGTAEFHHVENLICKKSEIKCGLGSINMDFSNNIISDRNYDISVGMGSIKITIQEGINAVFKTEKSILSNLDFQRMNLIKSNIYRNESFDKKKPTITFNCNIGMGTISLVWIK